MAESWTLKLFSGPHIGAEITLDPGTWILGRHPECDLVLADDALSERHIELKVDKESVKLKSLQSGNNIYLSGESQGTDCTLSPYEIVLVGGLYLAIGHAGQTWPELSVSGPLLAPGNGQKSQVSPPSEPQDTSASKTDVKAPDKTLSDGGADSIPVLEDEVHPEVGDPEFPEFPEPDMSQANTQPTSPASPEKPDLVAQLQAVAAEAIAKAMRWCRENALLLGGSGLATLLALLVASFIWLWTLTDPEVIARENITPAQQAEVIIGDMNLPDIKLASLPDESVLVSGYITDNTVREKLLGALDTAQVPYSFRAVVMSDMRATAAAVLEQHGFGHMSVALDTTPGSLVLSGYAADTEEAERVRNTLMEEVHGLRFLADQVEYQATRIKTLRTLLKENGLAQTVQLLETPDKVILRGKLNNVTQGYKLKEVVQSFRKKYKNRPELHIDASLPSTDMGSMQPLLAIRSISLGQVPYVILQNGEKYLRGAKLANGYILENINLEYLTLRLGDERIKYFIGGSHGRR
ncbi:MAG: type III secretion system inner membrane ring subunit SctD [Kistimonas sp.]|nr:type III secretion system inner membrane ring subunit SctD [Kistimonas sp.]